jgi:hypothetical protein
MMHGSPEEGTRGQAMRADILLGQEDTPGRESRPAGGLTYASPVRISSQGQPY